jgi:hypothetical protein
MSQNTITQPNWRVLEPNTLRAYTLAGQDFQQVTGVSMDQATAELALAWQRSMERRGFSINTIRQRLSALRTISGVQVQLPRREKAESALLSGAQIRSVMSMVADRADRILLVRLLTLGSQARTTPLSDNLFSSHLLGAEQEHTLGSQKVTRLLKRYARNAGLNARQVNLRVWCLSGRKLVETCTPAELASLLQARAEQNAGKVVEWAKSLHGIGRRSRVKA